ncbi:bleomycin resistance protein [Candidatus Phycosocius spiralis]|uniref:Bleomycin resistance protein n=1 Tax=Candidatus Phycosocius spiralis TaxID=2815099 RepID=A0ABQ4PZL1_9PROT|nr:VOC family protein [Candidatus Phycosocius spiralis]GIU68109.1 aldoketomutase [Candidatus Phycosocius spiralis]
MKWAALVPELVVSDITASRAFYIGVLGFVLEYEREGFAYLSFGEAQIMLEQVGNHWSTGMLERPFGRGINLQIEIEDIGKFLDRIVAAGLPLFQPLQTSWYRADEVEHGQSEFLIQDLDGYLLRFCENLGERPA